MPKIVFVRPNGEETTVEASIGTTLLEAAEDNNLGLDGPCGGNTACGRCHVVIDQEWFTRLPKASEQEEELLDIVCGVTEHSRLACNIEMTAELDGIKVHLPE